MILCCVLCVVWSVVCGAGCAACGVWRAVRAVRVCGRVACGRVGVGVGAGVGVVWAWMFFCV